RFDRRPWRPPTRPCSGCAAGCAALRDAGADPVSRTLSLSVLVVSWNGKAHLEALLPSLAAQQPVDGCTIETLVLDNGSHDGTAEWLAAAHPQVRVIARRENLGFAGGNNLLAAEAHGDVLLLLNNDMRAE